jgi:ATP-binding cassette subfamily B protein
MIKLLRFLKPYRMTVVLVTILAFAQSMANLYLPTLLADIIDNGVIKKDTSYIWRTGGLMLLVTLAGTICAIIGAYYGAKAATGFGKGIRASIFKHVTQYSLHEFDSLSTASLITRTTNDTTQVQQVMVMILLMLITAPMLAIGGIILAIHEDATLALVLVVAIPVLVGAILILMTKAIPLFQVMQIKLDKLNLILDEGLTGVRVVRAFDRVRSEEQRFDQANAELTDVAIRVNRLIATLMPIMMLVLNGSSVAIVWFGANLVNSGDMQIGQLTAFLLYAMQILFAMLMVSMIFIMLPRSEASAKSSAKTGKCKEVSDK